MHKKIIIICLLILILGGITFFAYLKIKSGKEDAFSKNQKPQTYQTQENSNASSDIIPPTNNQEPAENSDLDINKDETIDSFSIEVNRRNNSNEIFASITSEHCNTDCEAFKNNFQYLEYCQQVCGISPIKDISEADCDDKKDLEKDYCLKDLAIVKKNTSLCQSINDANIQQTCKNRIVQDVLEGN